VNEKEQTPDRISDDLIDRFLAGECSEEERERVERWAARPEGAEMLDALRSSLEVEAPAALDVDAAWARLQGRIQGAATATPAAAVTELAREVAGRRIPVTLLRLAAVLVVASGVVALWRSVSGPGGGTTTLAFDEYSAPVGATRELRLADGSLVTLAPTSRLRVPRDLSGDRDVSLEGEAFFRVTHIEDRPFRVLSGDHAARVLGTEFDVRTGREAAALTVAVAGGRVGVGTKDADPAAVLEAGQMAVLDSTGAATVGEADLNRILAWTTGRIELDDLTLAAALTELERWYDVELVVPDSALASRRVSASFRGGEPIEQVLESLTLALSARFERDGRRYTVATVSPD
jgi:ferric-dicitrate binding protein FerR (iron transport regulator)